MNHPNYPDLPETPADPPKPEASPWAVSPGNAPPPPPPPLSYHPYGAPTWQPPSASWPPTTTWQPAPPVGSRGRRVLAGSLALIFAAGIGAGVLVARATGGSQATSSIVPSNSAGGAPGNGGGGAGSGSPGGSLDTRAIAARVTPGIVNVNITLQGGSAAGTGMVITSTGQVLTNNHVIDGETSLTVQLASTGKTYTARVMGYDVADDVSLLQIEGGGSFTTVNIGDSSAVTVGQPVVAMGNAQGANTLPAVTSGSVTGLNQAVTATDQSGGVGEHITGLIEVDAPIQPGDSGGPLVSASATVIGMDTAAQVSGTHATPQASTSAYAIPINHAISIVKQIQSGKSTRTVHIGNTRALIGIGVADSANGVKVNTVEPASAAAQAGVAAGAIITSVDGTPIDTNTTLRSILVAHNPGDGISIAWTDAAGTGHTATITLGSGPPA